MIVIVLLEVRGVATIDFCIQSFIYNFHATRTEATPW